MNILEVLDQVRELLRTKGRITYRVVKRQFDLDDEYLEDLKAELIDAEHVARDEDGKVLVWVGEQPVVSSQHSVVSREKEDRQLTQVTTPRPLIPDPQPPIAYTPPHLAERIRAEQAALEARSGTDGERKTITALFADLKGSTALIEGLDPEEARAIIDPALQLMMDAVHQYDGYVAQALGDGIFALFGAPLAHEDHPQRALYAALRMQDEMRRYADTLRAKGYPPLQMRVGINTGEVVVRSIRKDDLHADYVPVGHSTNLAARMEQLANPGTIVVSAYTHRLTDGYFAFKDLGPTQIKGVEEALNIYEVLGAGPLRTKLQVAARRGLTRFVGRQSELEQLHKALEQAKAGHGQIVGVMGEPGLGKSRLFYEFKLLSQSGCLVLEAYSISHGKASPYLPVIELLKSYCDITLEDEERKRREKVTGKVLTLDRSLEETLPYLLALLGIDDPTTSLQQMDAQIRRRRTFEAIKKLFLRESLNQPLILVFEDLHWIDGETQGVLDVLSESVAGAPILLLVNYRPEYRHEWGSKTYYTQLRLAPLGNAEAEEFLDELLGTIVGAHSRAPLQALRHLILEKTQGTPFFMEEIVQELVEQGVLVRNGVETRQVASLPKDLHIPPTVQGVLASRIDRLMSDEKALLQQLSVIGREFPLTLVRRVVPQSEDEVYRLLVALQRKEFLYEQPAFPEVEYIFKHALTQEVAYNSVLQERRKALHEQTARAIEDLYSANLDEHYSELAHHYSRSGNTQKAIEYLHLAGQQATQRSANMDAVTYVTAALELLKSLPDTPERNQRELTLQLTLGVALMSTKGWSAPEVERVYYRARELCQHVRETGQILWVLMGLWVFHLIRSDLRRASGLGKQILNLAQHLRDDALLIPGHYAQAWSLFALGESCAAQEHWERVMAQYHPEDHRIYVNLYSVDFGIGARVCAAFAFWCLGYPDQAVRIIHDACTLARQVMHSFSLAFALEVAAIIHQLRYERQEAKELAEAAVALSTEQGFPVELAMASIPRSWTFILQGQGKEELIQIKRDLTTLHTLGAGIWRPYFLALLAEGHGESEQAEEGLAVLAEAIATVESTGERWYEAELYRLRGELTLAQSSVQSLESGVQKEQKANISKAQSLNPKFYAEAEACFLKAIEIAQKQQAKSLELRATVSLARLWQQQSKQKEAHELLSEIYNWFTEGFDTKDLQDAKALLDEL